MAKRKRTNNDLQNDTQKTKDQAIRTPLKPEGELSCPARIGSFGSTPLKCTNVSYKHN